MKTQSHKIFTIGYEGKGVEEFVFHLKKNGITRILDVRALPLSRKKGFSKSSLKSRLEEEDINYVHLKALGSPAEVRKKLKEDGDYKSFFKAYNRYLVTQSEMVEKTREYICDGVNCLMCFEEYADKCHRLAVVDYLKTLESGKLEVRHL